MRRILYGVVVILIGAAVWYFAARKPDARNRYTQPAWAGKDWPPPVPVRTVVARQQALPLQLKAIGTVTPLATVTIRSRVSGPILRVAFEEGQQVERGQVLAEIDPAPYRVRLEQAQGQHQQNVARLESARADLNRIRELHGQKLVTDQQLDIQQALVSEREGAVAASLAQVNDARLQLGYTRIEAPIAGRTGFRRVDVGNLVRESDTNGLVVITQTRPITVVFTIAESALPSVLDPIRAGQALSVEAWDRRESAVLARGELRVIDNQIDPTTGTVRLKAEFANADERLFPNQFVNIRLHVGTLEHAIVIPGAAVQFGSNGTYVYVIDAQKKARVREVVLGPAEGAEQSITKGLAAGESVVLEGLDRIRDGRAVVIVNDSAAVHGATAAAP